MCIRDRQVDLKASAVYRKMALTAQDSCFTWSAQGEAGTVDQNGVFTAGSKSASGTLTVSAGGKTISIPVSVAGHVKTLENGEAVSYTHLFGRDERQYSNLLLVEQPNGNFADTIARQFFIDVWHVALFSRCLLYTSRCV